MLGLPPRILSFRAQSSFCIASPASCLPAKSCIVKYPVPALSHGVATVAIPDVPGLIIRCGLQSPTLGAFVLPDTRDALVAKLLSKIACEMVDQPEFVSINTLVADGGATFTIQSHPDDTGNSSASKAEMPNPSELSLARLE